MLYLTPDPRHLISDTGTWYVILDTWSRHLISDTGTLHVILDTWSRHLISDTNTWHVITWHLIPDTWYMTLDDWHAITYLTCFHMSLVIWPNIMTPDWILWHLTPVLYYRFMTIIFIGTWHDYYIITRHLVLLNSCAPELLYTRTPETERLLTLCSWYYTHVDPRNKITMDIGLLWIPCGHSHWTICNNWITYTGTWEIDGYGYSFCVYGGHTNVVQLILGIRPGGDQVFSWGVLAPLLPCLPGVP